MKQREPIADEVSRMQTFAVTFKVTIPGNHLFPTNKSMVNALFRVIARTYQGGFAVAEPTITEVAQ